KYYLVDAGYPQIKGYLGPYKDQEFQPYDDNDELLPSGGTGVMIEEEMVKEQNLTHRLEMADERERIANLLMSG
ncbi:PREDICTED: L10-interacting MYB domain-containing-like, partial [Prunus dulcis]